MKTTRFIWVILALILGNQSIAQEEPFEFDLSQLDVPYEMFVLNNGLKVVIHEDHKAPIVAVNVWYHVGSKDEKLGKTGFAHLLSSR